MTYNKPKLVAWFDNNLELYVTLFGEIYWS
jgi:hypothetical protein